MGRYPDVDANGALHLSRHCVISANDVTVVVTTSGGPGGQHANRSLTGVTVSVDLRTVSSLGPNDRALLLEALPPVVRSTATRFRSQGQNKTAALEQLARKLAGGLHRDAPRRPTKPTKASQARRVDEKKARGRTKALRRSSDD